ncbi:hypothetical protein [Asaia sp. VD9]|uniref:hypothetical protein n=1 Tax=Asaia sp. VD9 TaxID=3081235 RepID=UPI003018E448
MCEQEKRIGERARESVPGWITANTLGNLTEVAAYRYAANTCRNSTRSLAFDSNEKLWSAIFEESIATENCKVELQGFCLTEWLPLRPGRFHTDQARSARDWAIRNSYIREDDENAPRALRRAVGDVSSGKGMRIFDPNGKMTMVDGGIGCVRLKSLPNRDTYRWPFGASSSMVAHEGVLVALSDFDHDRLIGDVRHFGGLRGTLQGTLRIVPRHDVTETMFGQGIPQVYIDVEKFEPEPSREINPIEVTAAVTFTSPGTRSSKLNVSYVTFNVAKSGELKRAVDWLEQIYVRDAYGGIIVTDFDEQTARFDRVRFSLSKLLNGLVSRADIQSVENHLGMHGELAETLSRRNIVVYGDVYGDIYSAEQAGAMGPNASVSDTSITINRKLDQ